MAVDVHPALDSQVCLKAVVFCEIPRMLWLWLLGKVLHAARQPTVLKARRTRFPERQGTTQSARGFRVLVV